MKIKKTTFSLIVALLPWLWMISLFFLVLRARIFLGYWPTSSHPDPKSLPFMIHHTLLWLGLYGVVWLFPVIITIYLFQLFFLKLKLNFKPILVYSTGISIIVLMFYMPSVPHNWVAWFLD